MRLAIALVAFPLLCTPAASVEDYFMTGNDAFPLCESSSVSDINVCTGMIMGFVDAGVYYDHELWRLVCLPDSVPSQQVRDVYTKHLRDFPADRHHTAIALFVDAMLAAFPC